MRSRPLLPAVLAILAIGCAGEGEGATARPSEYTGPRNGCRQTAECGEGQRCDEKQLRCVVEASAAGRRFVVTVDTAKTRGLGLPAAVFEIEAGANGQSSLISEASSLILPPVTVVSRLRAAASQSPLLSERNLRARLAFFSRAEALVGLPATPVGALSAPETGVFEVVLAPGVYDVVVSPLIEETSVVPIVPPTRIDGLVVDVLGGLTLESSGEPALDLVLAAAASPRVTGIVRRAGLPEGGLTVDAVDRETGAIASTVALTNCATEMQPPCGAFAIGLRQGVESFDLRLRRPEEPAYPVTTLAGLTALGPVPSSSTSLPSLGQPATVHFRVEGRLELKGGALAYDTLAGCRVVFRGVARDGGVVELVARTNESGALVSALGNLGVPLYPGTYEAFVYPAVPVEQSAPAYAAFALEPFEIVDGVYSYGPTAVTLSPARWLDGEVKADGAAVPGARVKAEPLEPLIPASGPRFSFTDEQGQFVLRLDPGLYRLSVEPPEVSGYAWSTDAVVDLREADLRPTVNLPTPIAVPWPGELPLGLGAEGIVVTWYEREEGGGLRRVGRRSAKTAADYVGLLPP